MKEINPKETSRAYAFEMWLKAPMPMVHKGNGFTEYLRHSYHILPEFPVILDQRNFISSISIPSPNCSVLYIAHVSSYHISEVFHPPQWHVQGHCSTLCNILLFREYAFPTTHALGDSLYNPHRRAYSFILPLQPEVPNCTTKMCPFPSREVKLA